MLRLVAVHDLPLFTDVIRRTVVRLCRASEVVPLDDMTQT